MSFFLNVNSFESKSVLDVLIEIFLYTKQPADKVINKIKNINLFGYVKTQLIKESNKSRSAKKANQGGYVRSLPTTYAQEGLYFEDDPRSPEIQSLDSEIQKITYI